MNRILLNINKSRAKPKTAQSGTNSAQFLISPWAGLARMLQFTITPRSVIAMNRLSLQEIRGGQPVLQACSTKPALRNRRLITQSQALELSSVFEVLANDTRLRLLHALASAGELCVTELAKAVGMKAQAVSNQLRRLVDKGILGTERRGNHIHYRLVDPCVVELLERGLCLAEDSRGRKS